MATLFVQSEFSELTFTCVFACGDLRCYKHLPLLPGLPRRIPLRCCSLVFRSSSTAYARRLGRLLQQWEKRSGSVCFTPAAWSTRTAWFHPTFCCRWDANLSVSRRARQ